MKAFEITLMVTSFLLLASGMIFRKTKASFMSEPILGLVAGILLGPSVFRFINMEEWGAPEKIMQAATQLTISMALLATAFRIRKGFFLETRRTQLIIVFVGMLGMCIVTTLLIRWIIWIDWMLCFLLGAILSPTDPVIASTIVSGDTAEALLPERLRHTISFESGANDGLAFPFVLLPLMLMTEGGSVLINWVVTGLLYKTIGGILMGLVIGYGAAKALVNAKKKEWTSKPALIVFELSLGLFVLGFLEVLHMNGIIGVFSAGMVANHILYKAEDIEQEEVQESMERILTLPVFFLFGLILPWHEWMAIGWPLILLAIMILLFRRLPVFFLMKPLLKQLPKNDDIFFAGWFGPIGVAALYYAMHSMEKTGEPLIWTIASVVIFSSTIIHGISGYHLSKWYGKRNGTAG